MNPDWKRWSAVLLRPEGLFGTKPATWRRNKASKLKAIKTALRSAGRVWLATDCDREGQLIGQEILEHCRFRGEVMRVMFTAQDPKTVRDAFAEAKPNADYQHLHAAAVAATTVRPDLQPFPHPHGYRPAGPRSQRSVIGVGRVKTPTLAIVCRREAGDLRVPARRPISRLWRSRWLCGWNLSGCGTAPTRRKSSNTRIAALIAARADGFTGPLSAQGGGEAP